MRLAARLVVLALAVVGGCAAPPPESVAAPVATAPAETTAAEPAPPSPVPSQPARRGAGAVVVLLRDPSGASWDAPTSVNLIDVRDSASPRTLESRIVERGETRFEPVAAGTKLLVTAYPTIDPPPRSPRGTPPARFVTVRTPFQGPAADGDVVRVDLTLGRPLATLTGRVLDRDGRPAAGHGVGAVLFGVPLDHTQSPPSMTGPTGPDGRFLLTFDLEIPEAGATVSLSSADREEGARSREVFRGTWPRDAAMPFDVGDVRLVAQDVSLRGHFVAPEGAAVDFTRCEASVARRYDIFWSTYHQLSAKADATGRFEIRGALPEGDDVRIIGSAPEGFVVESPALLRGPGNDVQLRIVAAGGFTGSVRLPRGIDAREFVSVTVEGEPMQTGDAGTVARIDWTGATFGAKRLRPGPVTVVVRLAGQTEPAARFALDVAAGPPARPAALQDIDLGVKPRTCDVRVSDETGAVAWDAVVWTRPAGAPFLWSRGAWSSEGHVRRTVLGDAYDVIAFAPGKRPAEKYGATGDVSLVMRPGSESEIVVRLAPGLEIPSPPVRLKVQIVWRGNEQEPVSTDREAWSNPRSMAHPASKPFGEDRTARFVVSAPGRWGAVLRLERNDPGRAHGVPAPSSRSTEALVTDAPQSLEVVVDAESAVYGPLVRWMGR